MATTGCWWAVNPVIPGNGDFMKNFDFHPEISSGGLVGTVALPRELADLDIWKQKPFSPASAICDLYLLANTDSGTYTLSAGLTVQYGPGWCLWSNVALSERWGWRRESVEKFLCELEKSEIITRQDIGKNRKVILITSFGQHNVQQTGSKTDSTTDSKPAASGQQGGQQNGTDRDRVSERETESETEVAPPVNAVSVAKATEHFKAMGSPYTPEEIREAWTALTARAVGNQWMTDYTKPPRPVADWRCALENELATRRRVYGDKNSPRDTAGTEGQPPKPYAGGKLTIAAMKIKE
jgi:hypothetical protein